MASKERAHKRTPQRIAIGRRFDDEMLRLDVSVGQAAKATNCSRRTIYYFLEGSSALDVERLAALSKLGLDILYIATGRRIIVAEH